MFLDRDRTIIEDTGYLSSAEAVRLLPGVERAIKSLSQEGYKIVVVTNQSGVARGLISEDTLEAIHAEMCRLLSAGGAHVDAVYYCPFHPEGTVEKYAVDSDLRKPQPGMLLKAAEEFSLNLAASWMVGDSPRDIEAGQRAGCRTIRLRTQTQHSSRDDVNDDVQADFTVRNLPSAARVILREPVIAPSRQVPASTASRVAPPTGAADKGDASDMPDETRREILRYVRQLARADAEDRFSFAKVVGFVAQAMAVLALLGAVATATGFKTSQTAYADLLAEAQIWALAAVTFQVMALTFFTLSRNR